MKLREWVEIIRGSLCKPMALGLMLAGVAVHAHANGFVFDNPNVGTPAVGDSGSTIKSIHAEWDSHTQVFSWEATFLPATLAQAQSANYSTVQQTLPTGFSLVVNNGPMPKGHIGELAVLYFDAETNPSSPIVTAYAYNGANSATAYQFSNALVPSGAPDPIVSSLNNAAFVQSASSTDNVDGSRTFSMQIDASSIVAHNPLWSPTNTQNNDPLTWFGLGFAHEIGIWFHPYNNIDPAYYQDGAYEGFLTFGDEGDGWSITRRNYGYYDVDNLQALPQLPEPATVGLVLLGLAMTATRRRSRAAA